MNQLRREDGDLLQNEHIECLCGLLNRKDADRSPYLVAAAIRALEQIGDAEAVGLVRRLTRDDIMEPVRGVAQRCLPGLKQRAEERLAAGTLLRPAGAAGDESLLRAASPAQAGDVHMLLRAADE